MAKIRAAITGVSGYVPDYVLTNQELEKMVDTTDEWITTRTGIKERRILKGKDQGASVLGIEAIRELLEKTGTDPLEVELLICATVTGDMHFPDTANLIAYATGLKNAYTFDLGAACSGFLFALTTGSHFISAGTHKKVIVVGADKMSAITDYTDRATCILFGDGAGAVLLEPSMEYGIMDHELHSDGQGQAYLYMRGGGSLHPPSAETLANKEHFIYQDGKPVFKAAVSGMSEVVTRVMARNGLTRETVSWLVPHQANMRIIQTVASMAEFPMDKVMVNIHRYGNTTAATLPLCLRDWENQLQPGDNIILTAFGGGFTWGALYLKWAYSSLK